MLLKIQTAYHADSYLLIDHVDNVQYDATPREFTSIDKVGAYITLQYDTESARLVLDPRGAAMAFPCLPAPDAKPEDFIGPLGEKRTYRLNPLTFLRAGKYYSITFDTIADICTDEGKTLERALAGGVLNY